MLGSMWRIDLILQPREMLSSVAPVLSQPGRLCAASEGLQVADNGHKCGKMARDAEEFTLRSRFIRFIVDFRRSSLVPYRAAAP